MEVTVAVHYIPPRMKYLGSLRILLNHGLHYYLITSRVTSIVCDMTPESRTTSNH